MSGEWSRTMPVTPDAIPALRWIETITDVMSVGSSNPLALTSVSALSILLGNATPLARRVALLMQSQQRITDLNDAVRVRPESGEARAPRPPVSVTFDACDLDAHQHEGKRSVTIQPVRADRVTAGGNVLRRMALRSARSVTVFPTDFESTGITYTVPVIAPGWIAVLALSRIAETNHHAGLGIVAPDRLGPSVTSGVDQLFLCREFDSKDLLTTLETVSELAVIAPNVWNGRDGVGAVFGLALQTIEANLDTLTALDTRRRDARLRPRGMNTMLDILEDTSHRLGMRFAPRFDFGR